MPLYLGFDSSTQSLTAVVIEVEGATSRVVVECGFAFDEALPQYGTRHGVLPNSDPAIAVSPPRMWADALDVMFARLRRERVDLAAIAAISGSAQQHGSVCLGAHQGLLASLDRLFSRDVAPIWMDSSTSRECREIEAAVGGAASLARHTGSRAFERFTAAQIRKFWRTDPDAYAGTRRIHLVSSFLASLLIDDDAPIDPGDASGMNLMDLETDAWWGPAVAATAPDLASKLPAIASRSAVVGTIAPYWRSRHGVGAASVVVWSGDNPSSLVGTGLVRRDRLCISLGTSDTIFGPMAQPSVDVSGRGHVFASPLGGFMGLTCFKNGSLARERVRDAYRLTWPAFSAMLASTPAGNDDAVMLPWFEPEITPDVAVPGVRRYALDPADAARNVRAVVEAQAMALRRHSSWMGVDAVEIYATGGASANREILQVIADVFGADVYQFASTNAAARGAAMRAAHAHLQHTGPPIEWEALVGELASPVASSRVVPNAANHALYDRLSSRYDACEAEALGL